MVALLRIRDVEALPGLRLRLELTDGRCIERDVSGLLRGPVLEALKNNPGLFARARAEHGTVVWPNGADLCPDVLIWGGMPPTDNSEPPD